MLKIFYNTAITGLIIFITIQKAQADFTISPVQLTIDKDQKIATINLTNNSKEDKKFQLIPYKVNYSHEGKEALQETKDLTIAPLMFTIKGGRDQIIRVKLKNLSPSQPYNKINYFLSIRELPHKASLDAENVVKLVTDFRIPIIIELQGHKASSQ